jgi:hypothetical protein
MRSIARLAPAALATTILLSACGGSAPTATQFGCENWCGSAQATVTIAGDTRIISGGGCYDTGAGIDIRIGDWQGLAGVSDYLALYGFPPGGPTPGPVQTGPDANSSELAVPPVEAAGAIDGVPFILGGDVRVEFTGTGAGTFSGTDTAGGGKVTGTFTCN